MLKVRNLRKFYGDFEALKDVSLDVPAGEVVGFLGPNGAGKSTTMRIVTGFIPASGGEVLVDGLDVRKHPMEVRRRIGYLPEHTPLYTDMRVREFLTYRARIKGLSRKEARSRVDYVIERAWLHDRPRQRIGTLSKGYRQRVGIADALVGNPRLLILDEPTIGLDPSQILQVRKLIAELAESHTIVLSTHILAEVEAVCSRVVIVARGETVAEDTVEGIVARFDTGLVQVTVDADTTREGVLQLLRGLEGAAEVLADEGDPRSTLQAFHIRVAAGSDPTEMAKRVSAAVLGAGWSLVELHRERTSLERIFVQLTQPRLQGGAA
jgi:ABC-2 type transport system ATP-binding protein